MVQKHFVLIPLQVCVSCRYWFGTSGSWTPRSFLTCEAVWLCRQEPQNLKKAPLLTSTWRYSSWPYQVILSARPTYLFSRLSLCLWLKVPKRNWYSLVASLSNNNPILCRVSFATESFSLVGLYFSGDTHFASLIQALRWAASTCTGRSTNHLKESSMWPRRGNSKCGPEKRLLKNEESTI